MTESRQVRRGRERYEAKSPAREALEARLKEEDVYEENRKGRRRSAWNYRHEGETKIKTAIAKMKKYRKDATAARVKRQQDAAHARAVARKEIAKKLLTK